MSLLALFGTFETGLVFALVALGVLLSFRILDFPDLTADGSFPLGAFACAVCMTLGVNPILAICVGFAAGALAGLLTAFLHVKLGILQLLSGIIVMTALYSVNLRVGGAPNVPLLGTDTVFDLFKPILGAGIWQNTLILLVLTLLIKFALNWFFSTETGLAMRATGANPRMARAQGISTHFMIMLGMALSNGLIALAGALFAQLVGGADVSAGLGTIVFGLAAVILGEALLPSKKMWVITLSVIIGSVVYRLFIMVAMGSETLSSWGLKTQDLNLITSVLVVGVMLLPQIKAKLKTRR
ncbi:ABC transporter permease [Alysiella filiformis]|uniref:Putative ABC transport system permease protein n=1 Tax=Alysiella filiformis DSM 16848 TaxID=1120981 RepID=A0A286E7I1_9NEIS|nr:ABC transporter permease [Alysiella filiformis]QMT31600.1 ABC transporter permease [Alysiella filiformis]UBQ55389.1 ABC transporter permease [Alysiella filiformis DSM 16848]SOD66814.1 putative ABC transport system permease protein [Alysiella filiformis DSM 16848]